MRCCLRVSLELAAYSRRTFVRSRHGFLSALAPFFALLLGVTDISVPWETMLLSVGLYVVVPLAAGVLVRPRLLASHGGDESTVWSFTSRIKPLSIIDQSYGIFFIAYGAAKACKVPHAVAAHVT